MTIQLHNMKITDNIPQGYKNSPLGIIPQEWEVKKLGDITEINPSKEEISSQFVTFLTMSDVSEHGGVIKENIMPKSSIKPGLTSFKRGDIIIAKITPCFENGKGALLNNITCEYGFGSTEFHVIRYRQCNKFIYYHTMSYAFRKRLESQMTGSAGQKRVPADSISSYKIPVPSLSEQQKIAEILSTWDKAIEKQMQLIEKFELRKKGLMQQLLTGKKRLPGFSGEWKKCSIKDFSTEVSLKNKRNENWEVLSCTKYDGLVPSLQYFGRQVFSKDVTQYKIVPQYCFAYATNHIEEGSIGYQSTYRNALISPMYTVFKTDHDMIDDIFLYKLLKSHRAIYLYNVMMEGSIDRRGGLRWDNFSTIKFLLPDIEEQLAITNVLITCDNEIILAKRKLNNFLHQKKGLMQVLLTGKKRVNI